ncbi:E3 ubiquitin-protein ligase Topors-like isoform X2 [Oenanthe melanoleuca]|uniref:E3 ubiquitin-protein ligase Topors-like isoform X2 n=1 Tax=Oenanthe melanoleuca TaxID=2939378 RepID=UPI0024C1C28C|nr:E3 ubiquitin-protein ligase Topors-like isoform X2 [Oenanthe melanoleuca]
MSSAHHRACAVRAWASLWEQAHMATGKEWSCPICCDARDDVAYTMPCGHRFCLGCILRWAEKNPACPLCRRSILTVKFSDRGGDDYLHCVITPPRELPETSSQAAEAPRGLAGNRAHGPADPLGSSPLGVTAPAGQQAAGSEAVGGILPELWAELFRRRRNLLNPVRPWLRQGLEMIYGGEWYQVKSAESGIVLALCVYGPDREVLVQRLQPRLQHYTASLVHGILTIIETQCTEEVRRLWHSHTVREEDEIPAASSDPSASQEGAPTLSQAPSSGTANFHVEEEASRSETALHGHPSHSPSVSSPAEQEQPQEEETRVAAGSSAPGQSRDPSPATSQRCRKRRTRGSPAASHSSKRQRREQL